MSHNISNAEWDAGVKAIGDAFDRKQDKAQAQMVPLEFCENCKKQMRPTGSRCIQCGHDPRRVK